ncbi:MAG TPA: PIG-L family deacetylase, partial [Gemmatimonadaceae bacterium]|nr:PIG-L family deacetylase [Gemmatimonadaceae bacterium]
MAVALIAIAPAARAQQGAVAVHDLSSALGSTARALMIGAHPDDEDTQLLGWLARGAKSDAAYLSLTRGDGGQNAIGNELGEALGVIRTEELLAARRVDGARQFFTRAYDFGFSKTAAETYRHWPKDSVFGDVVRIVRAFRPHLIVAVFSGTPRDGHGHHQVSGMLAKEAYEASMDTVRFPVATYGAPWTVSKFYRVQRGTAGTGALKTDVGVYDAVRGQSLGEIAGISRSQHRSQGFGVPQPRGALPNYVRREATRVNESVPAEREASMFDGLDPMLTRFAASTLPAQRALLDSIVRTLAMLRTDVDLRAPWSALPRIDAATRQLVRWCARNVEPRGALCRGEDTLPATLAPADADLVMSSAHTFTQLQELAAASSGLLLEATVNRELVAEGDTATLTLRVTNRGPRTARVSVFTPTNASQPAPRDSIAPGEAYITTLPLPSYPRSAPWWLQRTDDAARTMGNAPVEPGMRNGDMFVAPASTVDDETPVRRPQASVPALVDGIPVQLHAPITWRRIDEVRGQLDSPVLFVPRIVVSIDGGPTGFARANASYARTVVVRVTANGAVSGPITVRLLAPRGLVADSAARTVTLGTGGETTVPFTLKGRVPRGRVVISATAEARVNGEMKTFATGYDRIDYEHMRAQHL